MKCIIRSIQYWTIESFIDEYGRNILDAGFTLGRLEEDEEHGAEILIELNSMEDLKKLAKAVDNNIIFNSRYFKNDIYSTLIIYDDYAE